MFGTRTTTTPAPPTGTGDAQASRPVRNGTGHRRLRRLVMGAAALTCALSAGAASTGAADAAVSTRTVAIDAEVVAAQKFQEASVYGAEDEFYVATLAFRSTPGVKGSTKAWFLGGLKEVDLSYRRPAAIIPDAQGRATFPGVTLRTAQDVAAGRAPELLGVVSVVFESDGTPFGDVSTLMRRAAAAAQVEIAKVIEPLSARDLAPGGSAAQLPSRLASAANRVVKATEPTVSAGISLYVRSWFDPDDLIDVKVSLFAAVEGPQAQLTDAAIGGSVPASLGTGGVVRNREYVQTFAGDGAKYLVGYRVSV